MSDDPPLMNLALFGARSIPRLRPDVRYSWRHGVTVVRHGAELIPAAALAEMHAKSSSKEGGED